ncbi:hypothetical protein FLJC2902T_31550 [Flavobacterium limnosediminis JC2902]|uniref:Lipoprotein n=1 Tax=Flavobacterium limnosediminis JC2902 TaxID=1341181 RepID=V6SF10_9FLAO|nr:hypothetical protein [Flavobacterium limnosediminis]ESU25273.1 hypothetical protein FLJC2902T_31550 [Flavobacterium limnosediminis JC2902]
MRDYKKNLILMILIFMTFISCNCKDENHIDKYDVNIAALETLPDNFYAYRHGSIFIDSNKYMIWFNLDFFGNVENVFEITDIIEHEKDQTKIIKKYAIDTVKSKIIAQKFVDLSREFKFGHINIDRKNKIAFSYKDGLREQYVKIYNDSLKNVYLKNSDFKLLKNGWFENIEN